MSDYVKFLWAYVVYALCSVTTERCKSWRLNVQSSCSIVSMLFWAIIIRDRKIMLNALHFNFLLLFYLCLKKNVLNMQPCLNLAIMSQKEKNTDWL